MPVQRRRVHEHLRALAARRHPGAKHQLCHRRRGVPEFTKASAQQRRVAGGGAGHNIGGSPAGPIYGLPGTTLRGGSFSLAPNSGGTGELAGVYAIDQNGAPNSIGDATAAGFRCVK